MREDEGDESPPDMPVWMREDWEPQGGWQEGSLEIEELEYLTHEELREFFDQLAEEWDVDVGDIWEMYADATSPKSEK